MKGFLILHIASGVIGVITGFLALFVGKGSTLHRRSGQIFVGAMISLGITAAILGVAKGQTGNVIGGILTAYLVVTAMTTVRPISRKLDIAATAVAAVMGSLMMIDGIIPALQGHMFKKGVPVPMILFLATVMLSAVAGDIKVMRKGPLRGSPRLVRHLWRMCFALFIAAGSFFSIRKRVATILPEPLLGFPIRLIPILLPFLAMAYWVWKIKLRKSFKPVRLRNPVDA